MKMPLEMKIALDMKIPLDDMKIPLDDMKIPVFFDLYLKWIIM